MNIEKNVPKEKDYYCIYIYMHKWDCWCVHVYLYEDICI